ncbi:WapI family immunity protein [Actinomadura kijaniata]|uniref:WapI family immunity protein n=1 Tax=Actinomadura kijaniata TaxID=46161 RepID=UPI003F1D5CAF
MRITGRNGVVFELRPVQWQFPAGTGYWDDLWLVVEGRVDLGERSWSFRDPALTITSARWLARWLRQVVAGRVAPIDVRDAVEHGRRGITFDEPVLSFTLLERRQGEVTVRGHFYAEAAPPWLNADGKASVGLDVDFVLGVDRLAMAADEWTRALNALPPRQQP